MKEMRLQTHKRMYGLLQMEENKLLLILHQSNETGESNQDVWRSVDMTINSCKYLKVITSKV